MTFKKPLILFILILLIGIFLRTYDLVGRAHLDHDSDLFSWIVKDIVVDKHFRLIGQLTSAPGIFIGPFFYYLLIPFYLVFNMDPIAASIPILLFAILTLISYYFVFSKLFNYKIALIISFLYAILIPNLDFDSRVVPSTTANLWVVWYFYTIIMLTRGKFKVLPLLGILTGLIWHIHIALIPALIAAPAALMVSKKLPSKKQLFTFLIALLITSLPLIVFEVRHNFSQTTNLLGNFSQEHGGSTGTYKLTQVLQMISKNINALFISPQSLPEKYKMLFTFLLFSTTLFISLKSKLISKKEIIPPVFWIFGVVIFFTVSSSLISEYYFYSLEIIFLLLVSLILFYIGKSKAGCIFLIILFSFYLIRNTYYYTTKYVYHKGYVEKKEVVEYIKDDAKQQGFPCFGISYITSPGENVGFRYLFFLYNMHIIHPSLDIPVYNIVIPEELATDESKIKFGHIGIVPPSGNSSYPVLTETCSGENTNLTDPMFGYVD